MLIPHATRYKVEGFALGDVNGEGRRIAAVAMEIAHQTHRD